MNKKPLIDCFIELGKDRLIESFKRYWTSIYMEDGRLTREISKVLETDLKNAFDIMVEIKNSGALKSDYPTSIKGSWIIDEYLDCDYKSKPYFHVWGERNDTKLETGESWITYSMLGADWANQLNWQFDMSNIDQTNAPAKEYTQEDILGIILFELTFFGCSPAEIEKRFSNSETETIA